MDLQERIVDFIEGFELMLPVYNDNNSESDSLSLYSLPSGGVIQEYMDGTQDKKFPFEIQLKVKQKDRGKGLTALTKISAELEKITSLDSHDNSFEFNKIEINNENYLSEIDEKYIYFRFTFSAYVTVRKGE